MTELEKLQRFCAYQERCHSDVLKKIKSLGIHASKTDHYIQELCDLGFLNENRFVESFINGKIQQKKWGKKKITFHLKQKGIDSNLIKFWIDQIDDKTYQEQLKKLFERKKLELERETNQFKKNQKIYRFLIQKGFDSEDIKKLFAF